MDRCGPVSAYVDAEEAIRMKGGLDVLGLFFVSHCSPLEKKWTSWSGATENVHLKRYKAE